MPTPAPEPTAIEHAPGHVGSTQVVENTGANVPLLTPGRVEMRARVSPLSSRSYALQTTIDPETQDLLRRAQELLGSSSGDVAQVLKLALKELVTRLEKRKFAATDRPRAPRPQAATSPHSIPAHVKRTVWRRDK